LLRPATIFAFREHYLGKRKYSLSWQKFFDLAVVNT